MANWVRGAVAIPQQGGAGVHAIDDVGLQGGIGDVGDCSQEIERVIFCI